MSSRWQARHRPPRSSSSCRGRVPLSHGTGLRCVTGKAKDDNRIGINNSHEENAHVELWCTIQVNDSVYSPPASKSSASASGYGAAALEATATYSALPTDNVYVCTFVEMIHANMSEDYVYDEDGNPSNGLQCGLAISSGLTGSQRSYPGTAVQRT